jgi:polyhydroxybutyrate depolymerase
VKQLALAVIGSLILILSMSAPTAVRAETAAGGACTPARPYPWYPFGIQNTLVSGGVSRTYTVRVPFGYDGTTAAPLLVVFHGHGMTAQLQAAYDLLGAKGTSRGYIVVYAQGLDGSDGQPSWNFQGDPTGPNDVLFADDLVTQLESSFCVDPQREYIAGHSAGSAFTGYLACQSAHSFSGAAMVSATMQPLTCAVDRTVSTIHFQGTNDTKVPYTGGVVAGTAIPVAPVETGVHDWAAHNRCFLVPFTTSLQADLVQIDYWACPAGREDVLYRVVDGSHGWPGTLLGTLDVPASDMILEFFDRH